MDFDILGRSLAISDSTLESELVVRRYDGLAEELLSGFDSFYAGLSNRATVTEAAMQYASTGLAVAAQGLSDLCVSHEIFEHNQDTIMHLYKELGCGSALVEQIDMLDQRIDEIYAREGQSADRRRARSDGRFRLTGGGFGVAGAAKGIAEAAAFNAATKLAHGVFNIGGKVMSSARAASDFRSIIEEAKAPLRGAIHTAIQDFYVAHIDVLGRRGLCAADTFLERQARLDRAAVMFGHLQAGTVAPDKQTKLALNCLALAPGQVTYYVSLAVLSLQGKSPAADIAELTRLATAVQLDFRPAAAAAYDQHYRQITDLGDRRVVANRLHAAAAALSYDNACHACEAAAAEFAQAASNGGPHGFRDGADELSAILVEGDDVLPITLDGVRRGLSQNHRLALRSLAKDLVLQALDGDQRYVAAFRTTAFSAIMDAFDKKDVYALFGGKMETVRTQLLGGKLPRQTALILSDLLLILAPFFYDDPAPVQAEIRQHNADAEARQSGESPRLGAAIAEALSAVPLDALAVGDRIPHTKLTNARAAIPLLTGSAVLALLDDTYFSSNENGIAFTATGLVWHNSRSKLPSAGNMNWGDFLKADIAIGKKAIQLGSVSVPLTKVPVDRLVAFLKALQDCLQGNTPKSYQPSEVAAGPSLPLATASARGSIHPPGTRSPDITPTLGSVVATTPRPTREGRQSWGNVLWSFEGRLSRQDYWLRFVLPAFGAIFLSLFIDGIMGFGFITLFMLFPLGWSAIAVGAKRCHDRNKSGWFQLINLIPLIGSLWLFVNIGLQRGTPGSNRFGPDPLRDARRCLVSAFGGVD